MHLDDDGELVLDREEIGDTDAAQAAAVRVDARGWRASRHRGRR